MYVHRSVLTNESYVQRNSFPNMNMHTLLTSGIIITFLTKYYSKCKERGEVPMENCFNILGNFQKGKMLKILSI